MNLPLSRVLVLALALATPVAFAQAADTVPADAAPIVNLPDFTRQRTARKT